jgi:glycosyltransferase involved in cell wall biosynthesis
MRIVHTESSLGWGGQEMRVLLEARGMIERGHEVHLFAPAEARIFSESSRRGVPATPVAIGRKSLAALLAMRRHLRSRAIDVVNTHSSTDSWLAALACRSLPAAPAIVRTRHISAPVSRDPLTRWLYRSAARRVVTTGETLRRELVEDTGVPAQQVISVPTGVDLSRYTPGDRRAAREALGLAPDLRWIGIVATLRSWKGHLHLLEALQSLPAAHLVIVGDGPMRAPIEAKIGSLGLTDRVRLVGQQEDPVPWLRALDVFCLPSYANEGVPQALMQAMAVGLPVVTTPVGSITEIVTDEVTGLVVPPSNPTALAGAIARVLGDAALAARLGEAARAFARRTFGVDRMLGQMEQVFREAMGR